MKALSKKEIKAWMKDRILQGVLNEEPGSCDTLEDAGNFCWHCSVSETDGKKVVNFTTSLDPVPFAIGFLTKTGKPRLKWLN